MAKLILLFLTMFSVSAAANPEMVIVRTGESVVMCSPREVSRNAKAGLTLSTNPSQFPLPA